MKLTVVKIIQRTLSNGDRPWLICGRGEDGVAYKGWINPKHGFWNRCGWQRVIDAGVGAIIEVGITKNTKLINGDAAPKIL